MINWNEPVFDADEDTISKLPDYYKDEYAAFPVAGSGLLLFSNKPLSSCGKARGFSVHDSGSKYGLCGGVMDKEDAKRLAYHILNSLELT